MLGIGTVLSWTAWVLVLTTLDPFTNPVVGPMLFYVSVWLAVIGTMTFLGFYVRHWFEKTGLPFQQIAVALRQAALLSSGFITLMLLQRAHLLNPWTFMLVVLLVVGVELFFLAGQAQRTMHTPAT